MKQKLPIQLILPILLTSISCSNNVKHRTSETKYHLIRDNLYTDIKGNIRLKTIDRSLADCQSCPNNDDNIFDRFLYVIYCDTCKLITQTDTIEGLTELKNIVDTTTFKHVKTDHHHGGDLYEDKEYTYFHKWMADGGTISLIYK